MKPTLIVLILLSILDSIIFFECNAQVFPNRENQENNSIHIHFAGIPTFNSTLKTKGGPNLSRPIYLMFYDDFESEEFSFEEIKLKKIANYITKSQQIILRRYLSYFEFQDFLVHTGDSLIINYDNKKPIIVKHSLVTYAPQDFNVENILNKKIVDAYSIIGKSTDIRATAMKDFFDDRKEITKQQKRSNIEKGKHNEELEIQAIERLLPFMSVVQNNAQSLLDSLLTQKQISKDVYEFYTHKYRSILLKVEIMSGAKSLVEASEKTNEIFAKRNYPYEYAIQPLESLGRKFYNSKATWVQSDQFSLRDPRESFDLIKDSELLNIKAKEHLLFLNLNIIANFFPKDVDKYLGTFMKESSDSVLQKMAQKKFQKDITPMEVSSDLHLLTPLQNQTTIEELLQKNKGKVLYFDFWASWCAPCIVEMKHSLSLKQQFEKRDVEVVFLSLDDNVSKWERASIKNGLKNVKNSFKILKSEDANFINNFKIKTIPRYMIIDKSGKIIDIDAPRPSNPETSKIIDKLLTR